MSKVLILTSSPQRDAEIDAALKKRLEKLGNEVVIHFIPVGAREFTLKFEPNIVVMPPIRNVFGYEYAETMIRWGAAVVLRHVEPGADSEDIKTMKSTWQQTLLYRRPKGVSLELLWGEPEADYLRNMWEVEHPVVSVGAFVADSYKGEGASKFVNRQKFCEQYGLDINKKTILLSSPWGLMEVDSDLMAQSMHIVSEDENARSNWIEMAKEVKRELGKEYNILATLHPGISDISIYRTELGSIGMPIDNRSMAIKLLSNCDYLVHAGSTMAVEMHWLNKPSFQFGDVNALEILDGNWWQRKNAPISRVSPFFASTEELVKAIMGCSNKSNANTNTIAELENGRYGNMDGNATKRAAELINKLSGEFKIKWPLSSKAPQSLSAFRELGLFYSKVKCSACNELFYKATPNFFTAIQRVAKEKVVPPRQFDCPNCGGVLFWKPVMTRVDSKNYWKIINSARERKEGI